MAIVLCIAVFAYLAICALGCSRIAVAKNRGADEWFVCGEIFGLIAVVAIVLLPPLPSHPRGAASAGTHE